ncbi:hypothetical protein J6590_002647 [Homalodisca vitripennis]|nr:hypothetical protein J6590_002647 [Homalodisca vitripennis]
MKKVDLSVWIFPGQRWAARCHATSCSCVIEASRCSSDDEPHFNILTSTKEVKST